MADETDRADVRSSPARELKTQWANFVAVLLSPDVLVLGLATVALVFIAIKFPSPLDHASTVSALLNAILTIAIAIASGLVGARVAHRLEQLSGRGVLVTRGKSAIRGLKLLHLNVCAMEIRTRALSGKVGASPELTAQAFEELAGRCDTLEEEVLNAIEEWQDIIPEANLSTQIGLITQLKSQQAGLVEDAAALRKELGETQDRSVQEKERLEAVLAEKEKQLQKVNRDLRSKEIQLSASVGSVGGLGSSYGAILGSANRGMGGITVTDITRMKKCDRCGKSRISIVGGDTCPYCFGVGP